MTPEERKAARARCEAATPAPWQTRFIFRALVGARKRADLHPLTKPNMDWPDADFTAHARTDLPAALDEIERLEGEVERLKGLLWEWTDMDPLRYDNEYSACPWCNFNYSNMRHEPDCPFVLARAAVGIGEGGSDA